MLPAVVVTSLPRTGTMSMCSMLRSLGYETYHSPLNTWQEVLGEGVAIADTPAFAPSVFEPLAATTKQIYIDRDFEGWFESMTVHTRLLRTYYRFLNTEDDRLTEGRLTDKIYYREVLGKIVLNSVELEERLEERFLAHRETALACDPLVYKFSDGWEPLCEFLGLNIPDDLRIPHLNNKTMGGK